MDNINIPRITIEHFEEVYIEHVIDTLRITRDEFKNKLEDESIASLNKKADRFITTYLKNRIENLTNDNWYSAKELFIQWKIFEGIEHEKESIDKKESLLELLELFRQEVMELEEDSTDKKKKIAKIIVVG